MCAIPDGCAEDAFRDVLPATFCDLVPIFRRILSTLELEFGAYKDPIGDPRAGPDHPIPA